MPRTENQSNYHYIVKLREKNKPDEEYHNKYFLTMKDAASFFGVSKSTCYDRLIWSGADGTNCDRWRTIKDYDIQKFEKDCFA